VRHELHAAFVADMIAKLNAFKDFADLELYTDTNRRVERTGSYPPIAGLRQSRIKIISRAR